MFKTYLGWIFDGDIKSPIPKGENIPEILKYNSPISHTYVISIFLNNSPLNWFLNKYFNNINLRYLEKEELFHFMKKCVLNFKIKKRSVPFIPYKRDTKLFTSLRRKIPILKNREVQLLCRLVEESDNSEQIYSSLGIDKPEKRKLKRATNKEKAKVPVKITLEDFLANNFSVRTNK